MAEHNYLLNQRTGKLKGGVSNRGAAVINKTRWLWKKYEAKKRQRQKLESIAFQRRAMRLEHVLCVLREEGLVRPASSVREGQR